MAYHRENPVSITWSSSRGYALAGKERFNVNGSSSTWSLMREHLRGMGSLDC